MAPRAPASYQSTLVIRVQLGCGWFFVLFSPSAGECVDGHLVEDELAGGQVLVQVLQ